MKVLAENKKVLFNYELLEKFTAGIVLTGQEVKSIKLGRMNLAGAFVTLRDSEIFLVGANVPPYQPKNLRVKYIPDQARKLLLTRQEIKRIIGKTAQKGLTLIPLKVYNTAGKVKVEFAIAKGKQKADKREKIRKRETDREIRRALKIRN